MSQNQLNRSWTQIEINDLYHQPFIDLLLQAQTVFRAHFKPNTVQLSTLLNIKTGLCPEDCAYCTQSVHYDTGLDTEKLMSKEKVVAAALRAKEMGATRFCMGAAWRSPTKKNLATVCEMISEIKTLGLETCATLGMIDEDHAKTLKDAGLDFYNHNIDTSEANYPNIISTRTYSDRINTIKHVQNQGLKVCCGGIIGLGETLEDRLSMLHALSEFSPHPESVPINILTPMPGTPLEDATPPKTLDFIRLVAVARILMPQSHVRLSSGRNTLSAEAQALCFMAGANSIHFGEKLLTVKNPSVLQDTQLLKDLGLEQEGLEYAFDNQPKMIPCSLTTNA